ncbi:MAG: cytochrome P450 [Benjaminiella poitrasii]|nr:MAG: cytochrome P450 [Benjaminiella poitrasii]
MTKFFKRSILVIQNQYGRKGFTFKTAVTLAFLYIIHDRIFKPPRRLRHIPYLSYFDIWKLLFKKEKFCDYSHRVTLPLINSEQSNGIYVKPGTTGWEVHIANPEIAKQILMKHENFPKLDFSNHFKGTLGGKFSAGSNIVFLNGHEWKSQRAIVNPAFRQSMPIQLFGDLTCSLIRVMEEMGETVDFTDLMERLTLDAIGRSGFGFDFNSIKNRNSKWAVVYKELGIGMQDPFYLFFANLDKDNTVWMFPKRKILHQKMEQFLNMLDEIIIAKRKKLDNNKTHNSDIKDAEKDLLTLMLEDEASEHGSISNKELKNNLCLFFLAGHDTTSHALSFAVYYLAKHPENQQKARDEVIEILGDEPKDIMPDHEQVKKLVYLNQVIKETLRIFGPSIQTIPRITKNDVELSTTFIPKGTPVVVDIYNIQHCTKVWENPDKFDPERFNSVRAKDSSQSAAGYLPFGNGTRQCLGMNFSLNEQRVVLYMLLRKFTWSLPEDSIHKDKVITSGTFFIGPHKLYMTFKKRYW